MTGTRAWGWVEHLRGGGTTPWAEWTTVAGPDRVAVPGAQQLELVRRLNLAGSPPPALVERVLAASAPGRGRPDLELVGAGRASAFGPRPVDPVDLPDDELLRVAAGLLAEDLVAAGPPPAPKAGRPRPWRRSYRLLGDPELAAPLRDRLRARGRPPGGSAPVVVVLATDFGRMLVHEWTARAFGPGVRPWDRWLARLARPHAVLPPRVDPVAAARRWEERVGKDRVHVVLDPAAVPALLGTRQVPVDPAPLAAEVPDLARRVALAVGLHVSSRAERTALMQRSLRPTLLATPGEPLVLPPRHREWARRRAEGLADDLAAAGYAVHGDPGDLLPGEATGVAAPEVSSVLALAMRTMLGTAAEEGA